MGSQAGFTLAAIIFSFPALADCPQGAETLLSCTVSQGAKALELCAGDGAVLYRFGKLGGPADLELLRSTSNIVYTPWPGIGSSIWEVVKIANGDYSYEVYTSFNRDPGNPDTEAGVEVSRGDDIIASVRCDKGSHTGFIDSLAEQFRAEGRCYDYSSHTWAGCAD